MTFRLDVPVEIVHPAIGGVIERHSPVARLGDSETKAAVVQSQVVQIGVDPEAVVEQS